MSRLKQVSDTALREHARLQSDLRYFCKRALMIKTKTSEAGAGTGYVPFVWNRAQEYLHSRIEAQLARIGYVRMFILKGRQQGISTYIAARFYHKATRNRGTRVFILSHHSSTTGTLFQIVDKYHDFCPDPLKPKQLMNNNRKMEFDNNSQYTVGTAGTGDIDRGNTNHMLHWSEVAFSDNVPELLTGVCQTVGDVDGTEKLYESTANGIGNYFHRGCLDAMRDDDDYELVFIPWYWQPEYRSEPPSSFKPTQEEVLLKQMYGLDDRQIVWRRNKINELKKAGHGESKFKQEYPCSIKEAFQASGESLFDADKVAEARKAQIAENNAPLILGVDPGPINDRTAITWRRGREWIKTEVFHGLTQMALAGKLVSRIEKNNVAKVFIDVAEGRGCVDRCAELGYGDIVTGIPFAMSPDDGDRYINKRAEMAGEARQWLEDDLGVSIPDNGPTNVGSEAKIATGDEIEIELGVIPPFITSSSGKNQLVAKKEIIKLYGKSPDIFDSFMLTFAQKVASNYNDDTRIKKRWGRGGQSELSAVSKRGAKRKAADSNSSDSFSRGANAVRFRRR